MKTSIKIVFAMIILSVAISSCKKSKKTTPVGPLGPNFPYALNTIISPAILDTLEAHGLAVHQGLTPATVNGIYLLSPDSCTFDNSGSNQAGDIFDEELFQFSNQDNGAFTISLAYNQGSGEEVGVDNKATFISGTGKQFTIFAQAKDTTDEIPSVELRVETGTLTTGGITNLQEGLYLVSKGSDPDNDLIPVGSTRIFEQEGGFSPTQTTFAVALGKIQSLNQNHLRIGSSSAAKHPITNH